MLFFRSPTSFCFWSTTISRSEFFLVHHHRFGHPTLWMCQGVCCVQFDIKKNNKPFKKHLKTIEKSLSSAKKGRKRWTTLVAIDNWTSPVNSIWKVTHQQTTSIGIYIRIFKMKVRLNCRVRHLPCLSFETENNQCLDFEIETKKSSLRNRFEFKILFYLVKP